MVTKYYKHKSQNWYYRIRKAKKGEINSFASFYDNIPVQIETIQLDEKFATFTDTCVKNANCKTTIQVTKDVWDEAAKKFLKYINNHLK